MSYVNRIVLLLVAAMVFTVASTASAISFTGLGGGSSVTDMTPDGSVVVGGSNNSSGKVEAFRWEAGQMIGLGTWGGLVAAPAAYLRLDLLLWEVLGIPPVTGRHIAGKVVR